jgi:hypothetical protein
MTFGTPRSTSNLAPPTWPRSTRPVRPKWHFPTSLFTPAGKQGAFGSARWQGWR